MNDRATAKILLFKHRILENSVSYTPRSLSQVKATDFIQIRKYDTTFQAFQQPTSTAGKNLHPLDTRGCPNVISKHQEAIAPSHVCCDKEAARGDATILANVRNVFTI